MNVQPTEHKNKSLPWGLLDPNEIDTSSAWIVSRIVPLGDAGIHFYTWIKQLTMVESIRYTILISLVSDRMQ